MLELKSGIKFENKAYDKFGEFCHEKWGTTAFKISTPEEDLYKGTDCIILGVPVDFTLDIENKNNIKKGISLDLGFAKITFAIRYANGVRKFEKPVLVLGFDMPKLNNINLFDNVELENIINTGMDFYFEGEIE